MTNFTVDEHGNQVFTHEGWEVQIWGPEWPAGRISVTSPRGASGWVEVDPDGIWVNGIASGTWHDEPRAFTIPWPVIEAIVQARAIVG
jgi:hypothetical protein